MVDKKVISCTYSAAHLYPNYSAFSHEKLLTFHYRMSFLLGNLATGKTLITGVDFNFKVNVWKFGKEFVRNY